MNFSGDEDVYLHRIRPLLEIALTDQRVAMVDMVLLVFFFFFPAPSPTIFWASLFL